MHIGVVFPQTEIAGQAGAAARFTRGVDRLGFSHITVYDHVLGADPAPGGPYTLDDPFHEPLVLIAHLSGMTERIGFFTGVLVLPQRQTALVAKQTSDIAFLSGGRLRVGVGVGWNRAEYVALGQEFGVRGRRLDEQITLLRRLWNERAVNFDGVFDRVEGAGLNPRPDPVPELWVGGHSEPTFRRGAAHGDGFVFGGPDREKTLRDWSRIKELLDQHGRDAAGYGAERSIRDYRDPREAAAAIGDWTEAGGSHVSVRTLEQGFRTVDEHLDYLAAVAAEVGLSGSDRLTHTTTSTGR